MDYIDILQEENRVDLEQSVTNHLVKNINEAVSAINSFNKLLIIANFQTIQSPNYEMQMRVDAEKYIIAYTEFMRAQCCLFFEKGNSSNENYGIVNHIRTYPIFYIDFTKDIIMADTLFNNLFYNNDKEEEIFSPSHFSRIVKLGVPNSEMLARLYDNLPLISHEISHLFRYSSLKDRNHLLFQMVAYRLSDAILKIWFQKKMKIDTPYNSAGKFEEMMQVVISETLEKYYLQHCEHSKEYLFDRYPMESFSEALKKYFISLFGNESDNLDSIGCRTFLSNMQKLYCMGSDYITHEDVLNLDKEEKLTEKHEKYLLMTKYMKKIITYMESGKEDDCLDEAIEFANDSKNRIVDYLYEKAIKKQIYIILKYIQSFPFSDEKKATIKKALIKNIRKLISYKINSPIDFFDESLDGWVEKIKKDKDLNEYLYDEKFLEFIRTITEINFISFTIYSQKEIRRPCPTWEAKQIIKEIHMEIRKRLLRELEDKKSSIYFRFSSDLLFNTITQLGILREDSTHFQETLLESLTEFSSRKFEVIISTSFQLYRECSADIGMCRMMNLNAFGYLRFCAKQMSDNQELYIESDATIDRISVVLALLLSSADTTGKKKYNRDYIYSKERCNIGKLIDDVLVFMESSKSHIKNKLKSKFENQNTERYHSVIDSVINAIVKNIKTNINKHDDYIYKDTDRSAIYNKFVSMLDGFNNGFKREYRCRGSQYDNKQDFIESWKVFNFLAYSVDKLIDIEKLLSMIVYKKKTLILNSNIKNALEEEGSRFYENNKYKWDKHGEFPYWGHFISSYYNDTRRSMLSPNDMLKHTLSFVMQYYYRNRLHFSVPSSVEIEKCVEKKTLDNWLNNFTGGIK